MSDHMLTPAQREAMQSLRGAVLDMDGVLYRGSTAIPGSIDGLALLRRHLRLRFFTNNSTKERTKTVAQLAAMGFSIAPDEIILVMDLVERLLLADHRGRRLLVIAEDHVRDRWRAGGLHLVEAAAWREAEVVVCAVRLTADHALLSAALNALHHGAVFIASNPDLTVNGDDGLRLEAGSYARLLESASGRAPTMIGKPEAPGFLQAMQELALAPEQTAMIGDHPDTDIAGAVRLGMFPVHVLSGITRNPAQNAGFVAENLFSFAAALDHSRSG